MRLPFGIAGAALLYAGAAGAQTVSVEAATDEARRGLSWSEGRATASGELFVARGVLDASARVTALRGSARHGGSDAVADLGLGATWRTGAVTLELRGDAHLFAGGRGPLDYGEVTGAVGYTFGPLQLDVSASYAPPQDALGGDNLYLRAGARAGIPLTPFTLAAAVGRTTGDGDGSAAADRLRPGGRYTDWRLGVERISGPLTLGVDYVGTNVSKRLLSGGGDARHDGDRVVARVRLSF
jgi:hypothetical protein